MKKTYTIFAGVNGVGKTTLYRVGGTVSAEQKRVNVDEILKENGGDWNNNIAQIGAMKDAARKIKQYLNEGVSFNQETTLAGNGIISNIKKARENGFTIVMYYVGLDSADLAVERVADRVRKGGHGIQEEDIRRRYEVSLKNLRKVIELCDEIYIYDNTINFRQIASFKKGSLVQYHEKCEWLEKTLFSNTKCCYRK